MGLVVPSSDTPMAVDMMPIAGPFAAVKVPSQLGIWTMTRPLREAVGCAILDARLREPERRRFD
jgi:hypothetical protein